MPTTREKLRTCTIYKLNIYGRVSRMERVRFVEAEVLPSYAQYTDVPRVAFIEARKRRACYFECSMPESRYVLVLAGSGHPEPAWHPAYDIRAFDALINEHIVEPYLDQIHD